MHGPTRRSPHGPETRRNRSGRDDDGTEGIRDQLLPTDVQDLVDPHARHGPGDPDEHDGDEVDLEEEPDLLRDDRNGDAAHGQGREDRAAPAAKVEDRDEGGARDHPQPLETEDEAEPHPRILRRPSLDEFRLRLGNVERDAFHLRHHRDAEDDETEDLRREDVPRRDREGSERDQRPILLPDDRQRVEGAGEEHESDDGQDHRDLVGHEHRGGAQPADEGVLVVRGPARDQDAERRERERGEDEQDAEVEVRDLESAAPGERGEDHQRRRGNQDGRDVEHRGVRVPRGEVLLLQKLDAVGDVLQISGTAVRGPTGAVKGPEREGPDRDHDAVSVLEAAVELPLDPHHREEVDQRRPDHDDRDGDEPRDEDDEQLRPERSHPESLAGDRVEPLRQSHQRRNQTRERVQDLVDDPDDREDEDLADAEQIRDQRRTHLSISPTQTSTDPRIATESASLLPRSMMGVAAIVQKTGLRIFTRYGRSSPSPIT